MGTPEQSLLQLAALSVLYPAEPTAVQAVAGASFSVSTGETVGLIGESGCGKSTIARAILGLLPPFAQKQGSVRFRGKELVTADEKDLQKLRGREIALISQDPAQALNPVLTVGTQIAEVLRSHATMSRDEVRSRVLATLASVGFENPFAISRRYPHHLSGGQRQRAAIAQAIACGPSLLIADEATSKLDARLKLELLELFGSLRERHAMAVLLITHEPAIAASFCQRVLVMYAGEIVESAPKESILRQPLHPYTQALVELGRQRCVLPSRARSGRFAAIAGEPQPALDLDRCYFESRCSQRMPECALRHPAVTQRGEHAVVCLKYE